MGWFLRWLTVVRRHTHTHTHSGHLIEYLSLIPSLPKGLVFDLPLFVKKNLFLLRIHWFGKVISDLKLKMFALSPLKSLCVWKLSQPRCLSLRTSRQGRTHEEKVNLLCYTFWRYLNQIGEKGKVVARHQSPTYLLKVARPTWNHHFFDVTP